MDFLTTSVTVHQMFGTSVNDFQIINIILTMIFNFF